MLAMVAMVILYCSVISAMPQQEMTVIAVSGLTMRTTPSLEAPIVTVIPYGSRIHVREDQPLEPITQRIDWVDGQWIAVEYEEYIGFVFDGFLTELKLPSYAAEFSPYDLELIYPLETWLVNNYWMIRQPDTLVSKGISKVTHHLDNGATWVQSNQHNYYKSEITIPGDRVMDIFHLLLAMVPSAELRSVLTSSAIFIENANGEIDAIKIPIEDPIDIRMIGKDKIRIRAISTAQYCQL